MNGLRICVHMERGEAGDRANVAHAFAGASPFFSSGLSDAELRSPPPFLSPPFFFLFQAFMKFKPCFSFH